MSLAACDTLVTLAVDVPGAYWYVPDIPAWWLWIFYAGFVTALVVPMLRSFWRWSLTTGVAWSCLGIILIFWPHRPDEFRCTFPGRGSWQLCGAGNTKWRNSTLRCWCSLWTGSDQRQIAPFLWHQGIYSIDEIFISHPDLDHFNGLPSLVERFSVNAGDLYAKFYRTGH